MQSDLIIEKIRSKMQESDPCNRTVVNVFQFHFTDADGELIRSMVFDFKELNIYEGTVTTADAEITIRDEDFFKMGTKLTTFEELIRTSKVKVQGDTAAIDKLMEKFRQHSQK